MLAEHVPLKATTKAILDLLIKEGVVDVSKLQYGLTKFFFCVGELAKN